MLRFLGKALASVVLTKGARQVVEQRVTSTVTRATVASRHAAPAVKSAAPQPQAEQLAAAAERVVTPERVELIRQAMRVRAAKQTILADLDDESRAKLVAAAMKALLAEGRTKE